MLRLTSRNNPRLKAAIALASSARERRKSGHCVLEGEHLVEAYAERHGAPQSLVVAEAFLDRPAVAALVSRFDEQALVVSTALFAEIAVLPAEVGVLAVVPTPPAPTGPGGPFALLVEEVQDPGNLGSMLRTAAAAGASDAWLSEGCAFAWSPKVLRAGMGAHFAIAIHERVDLVAYAGDFRARGGAVVALVARDGIPLYDAALAAPLALAIGNEGAGLSSALVAAASTRVTIPMPGAAESLNAGAATAVALFECVRRGIAARRPG